MYIGIFETRYLRIKYTSTYGVQSDNILVSGDCWSMIYLQLSSSFHTSKFSATLKPLSDCHDITGDMR